MNKKGFQAYQDGTDQIPRGDNRDAQSSLFLDH